MATVVMPVRNGESTIAVQLQALSRQDFGEPWELVVADNGSTDATVDVAKTFRDRLPSLRVVPADGGVGINVGRNAGVRASRAGAVVFCDADDEVHPAWLRRMVEALEDHDAVGGILELRRLNDARSWAAAVRAPDRRAPLPPALEFYPYPVGANCGVRRTVWDSLGGFDETLVYGGDEVEFFWRLQVAGFRLGFVPSAVVHYRLPRTNWTAMKRGHAKGRAAAMLYTRFERHGARFRPLTALRSWIGLLARSYRLLGRPAARRSWLIRLAQQTGRLHGGIEHRRVFF